MRRWVARSCRTPTQPRSNWSFNCKNATSQAISNGYRLTLPLHPLQKDQQDTGRYTTPDQRYDVTGFVRDRKQPADYKHLPNAADGATDIDASPQADTEAGPAHDVDMGWLVLDRIVPDGILTYPEVEFPTRSFAHSSTA